MTMGQRGSTSSEERSLHDWLQSHKWDLFRFHMGMFTGSLVVTIFVMPIVAALVTVMLYLAFPNLPDLALLPIPLSAAAKVEQPLINGVIITFCLWLIAALFFSLSATARKADARSYGGLRDHLSELEADLSIEENTHGEIKSDPQGVEDTMEVSQPYQQLAQKEAIRDCSRIVEYLSQHRSGISWVLGSDYLNMWEMYHRAEEAVIAIMPRSKLVGEMRHDQLAIKSASINNREELLDNLQQAIAVLDPASVAYLKECQSNENCQVVEELRQTVDQHKEALKTLSKAFKQANPSSTLEISVDGNSSTKNEDLDVNKEAAARMIARQVRRALNEYRSDLWAKLLETRNQLLVTIALTGIVTYALLFISIVASKTSDTNTNILAAVAFYIVGALTGLSGRFHKELGSSSNLVGDYHLSLVRLIAIPLLSGLAGIGGVLIVTMLTAWGSNGNPPLSAIFSITPGSLVIAAAFGLTPNLLLQSLQKRAEKYASDLEKSEAEGPKSDNTNA
jgi:hypothetical protein